MKPFNLDAAKNGTEMVTVSGHKIIDFNFFESVQCFKGNQDVIAAVVEVGTGKSVIVLYDKFGNARNPSFNLKLKSTLMVALVDVFTREGTKQRIFGQVYVREYQIYEKGLVVVPIEYPDEDLIYLDTIRVCTFE